jgi:hypothetical protein
MPRPRKQRSLDVPNHNPSDTVSSIGDNKRWFESAKRRAKIDNFRWHDLRHTFCSRLAQAGVNLKVIQQAAGHKTIQNNRSICPHGPENYEKRDGRLESEKDYLITPESLPLRATSIDDRETIPSSLSPKHHLHIRWCCIDRLSPPDYSAK